MNFTKADIILQTDGAYLAVLRERALLSVARETVQTRQLLADQVSALFQNKLKSSLDLELRTCQPCRCQIAPIGRGEQRPKRAGGACPYSRFAERCSIRSGGSGPLERARAIFRCARPTRSAETPRSAAGKTTSAVRAAIRSGRTTALSSYGWPRWHRRLCSRRRTSITGHLWRRWCKSQHSRFQWRFIQGAPFEAEERAAAAGQRLRDVELRIAKEVRVAWLDASSAHERLGLTQQLLDQAKLALDLAQTRYNLGLSSIVELSQSQLQYTSAEIARSRAQYDYDAQETILKFKAGLLP